MVAQHLSVQVEDVGDEPVVGTKCLPSASLRTLRLKGVVFVESSPRESQECCQEAGLNMSISWGRSTTGLCNESTRSTRDDIPYDMLMNSCSGIKRLLGESQAI